MTPSLMIQWKLDCRSRKQKRKTQPITRPRIEHCDWFTLLLLLATPTMPLSLDRKRRSHKRMQRSASESIGLIFTRSHRSTLLITTPTTTPSLVKTSLRNYLLWAKLKRYVLSFSLKMLSDVISRMFAGRLFHSVAGGSSIERTSSQFGEHTPLRTVQK